MIFVLRVLLVALGFFGVLYCLLSLLLACAWRYSRRLRSNRSSMPAGTLFTLRVLPLAASAFITITLAIPAFLRLESNSIDEDLGTIVFCIVALVILAAGAYRAAKAHLDTSRVVAEWMKGAHPLDVGAITPALGVKSGAPPLLLVGIAVPQVVVSETAVALLTHDELRLALQHEMVHMRSCDNLKKLLFHCVPFPGMSNLENTWQEATELAADCDAVSNRGEAIDLAAALLKLAQSAPLQSAPALATGLVSDTMLVKSRVEALLNWNGSGRRDLRHREFYLFAPALAVTVYVFLHYSEALLLTHQITEWFVH
jgi:beta-lactamase regulating signal transducer with metallopeptidase domain